VGHINSIGGVGWRGFSFQISTGLSKTDVVEKEKKANHIPTGAVAPFNINDQRGFFHEL
jgi:hypothetical protein